MAVKASTLGATMLKKKSMKAFIVTVTAIVPEKLTQEGIRAQGALAHSAITDRRMTTDATRPNDGKPGGADLQSRSIRSGLAAPNAQMQIQYCVRVQVYFTGISLDLICWLVNNAHHANI